MIKATTSYFGVSAHVSLQSPQLQANVSQPNPRTTKGPVSPIKPPARVSSMRNAPDFFTIYQESPTDTTYERTIEPRHSLLAEPLDSCYSLNDARARNNSFSGAPLLPHAVTTPDDTALTLTPRSPWVAGTELPGVPEEDEEGGWKRSAPDGRPSTAGSSLRHAKSFPNAETANNKWACPSIRASVPSISSSSHKRSLDEDEGLTLPMKTISPWRKSRRLSVVGNRISASWAEADCDFDWEGILRQDEELKAYVQAEDASSGQGTEEIPAHATIPEVDEPERPLSQPDLHSHYPTTEMDHANSQMSASPILGLHTATLAAADRLQKTDSLVISPPLMIPGDSTLQSFETESLYQDILDRDQHQEHMFPFPNGPLDISNMSDFSPRSSHSPISKCSSSESFMLSRSGSAARRHRNTMSQSSLPDLVHSKNSIEQFNISAEHLADRIASLNMAEPGAEAQRPQRPVQSLVKQASTEAARQSMLAKTCSEAVTTPESTEPVAPPSPSSSTTPTPSTAEPGPKAMGPPFARRMRAASSASSLSQRTSRASYSLFPPAASRATV